MKSYQQALDHYNSIKKPPRSKHWNNGAQGSVDNGKPVRRASEPHMAIHMRDDGVIYYRLYDTHIATFYPPEADGSYKVVTKYCNSQTTHAFMCDYNLHFYNLTTTEDKQVCVPYVQNGSWRDNHLPTATLYFNADDKLIKERSHHQDVYTLVSSPEDKAKRKELRKNMESIVTLATFNMPKLLENAELNSTWGAPFGTAHDEPREVTQLKRYVGQNGASIDDPQFNELFMSAVQGVFDVHASRRAYNANAFIWVNTYWNYEKGCQYTPEESVEVERLANIKKQEAREKVLADITPEDVAKALTNVLLSAANIKTGSVKKPWGQFMPTLPSKWLA